MILAYGAVNVSKVILPTVVNYYRPILAPQNRGQFPCKGMAHASRFHYLSCQSIDLTPEF
jgi:hypothetical protein